MRDILQTVLVLTLETLRDHPDVVSEATAAKYLETVLNHFKPKDQPKPAPKAEEKKVEAPKEEPKPEPKPEPAK